MSGPDITIYEADETLGGGFFLTGDAKSGYNLVNQWWDNPTDAKSLHPTMILSAKICC